MKIAMIGTAYPFRGGLASYNERMVLEFLKEGHDVTIYTFSMQYPKFLFPGKSQYSSEEPPEKLKIVECINSINPLNWLAVGKRISKAKPDLVLIKFWLPFMGACFGTILRRIKKNKHSKVISIIDNMIPHESRIGDKALTNYFVKPVDAFIAMSKKVYNEIDLFVDNKPKALSPHPLFDNFGQSVSKEEACKHLNLSVENKYILFFGLIRKYKGLDLLLEAFADEKFRGRNIKLIIAGEFYSDKKDYTDLIEKYSLENDIILTDCFIPDSEVKYYFNISELVAQPYKSATQSGVTQIAYHFNTPMIVTDVGGLSDLCPDGKVGYVVSPEAEKISNAILKFFENKEQINFTENIIEEKKKYSWAILVTEILKLFSRIESN